MNTIRILALLIAIGASLPLLSSEVSVPLKSEYLSGSAWTATDTNGRLVKLIIMNDGMGLLSRVFIKNGIAVDEMYRVALDYRSNQILVNGEKYRFEFKGKQIDTVVDYYLDVNAESSNGLFQGLKFNVVKFESK